MKKKEVPVDYSNYWLNQIFVKLVNDNFTKDGKLISTERIASKIKPCSQTVRNVLNGKAKCSDVILLDLMSYLGLDIKVELENFKFQIIKKIN